MKHTESSEMVDWKSCTSFRKNFERANKAFDVTFRNNLENYSIVRFDIEEEKRSRSSSSYLHHRDRYLVTVVSWNSRVSHMPEVEIFLALRKVHDDRRVVLDTKRTRRHRHRLEYSNEFYSSGVESETPKLFRGNVTGNFWSNILLIYELII